MAHVCDACGKRPGFGRNVPRSRRSALGHTRQRTARRWNPNIQSIRTAAGGGTTIRRQVCTSCLKAGKLARA